MTSIEGDTNKLNHKSQLMSFSAFNQDILKSFFALFTCTSPVKEMCGCEHLPIAITEKQYL